MSLLKRSPPNPFRPVTPRQRRWIIVATLLMGALMWGLLLFRPGAHPRVFPPSADAPTCVPGQTSGCVGGKADVILIPASSPSAAR